VGEREAMSKIELDVNHNDKTRMEAFLRSLNEQFKPVAFDWKSWAESDKIVDGVKIINTDASLTITIIFLDAYNDANIVARANHLPANNTARWNANGAVMYLVESLDQDKVAHVLGVFAGKE
jgi:hypothetical protein